MQINNRSIQDMQIFGNPSHIPIVIVERVMNARWRSSSENSYLRHFDVIDSMGPLTGPSSAAANKKSGSGSLQNGRVLRIVVFVHGFQASFTLQPRLNMNMPLLFCISFSL